MAHRGEQSRHRLHARRMPRARRAAVRGNGRSGRHGGDGRELIAISVLSRSFGSRRGHQRLLALAASVPPHGRRRRRILQQRVPATTAARRVRFCLRPAAGWRSLEFCLWSTPTGGPLYRLYDTASTTLTGSWWLEVVGFSG